MLHFSSSKENLKNACIIEKTKLIEVLILQTSTVLDTKTFESQHWIAVSYKDKVLIRFSEKFSIFLLQKKFGRTFILRDMPIRSVKWWVGSHDQGRANDSDRS